MKALTIQQKEELEKSVSLATRVMKGTDTYRNNPVVQQLLEKCAKEMGMINFYYANPELILNH